MNDAADCPIERLIRKLGTRDAITSDERAILMELFDAPRDVARGGLLVRENAPLDHSILLLDGFVCRRRDIATGDRMILEIHVPGDFLDLQGFLLKRLEHDVAALSMARVALVAHERLRVLTERWPHLSRMLWFTTLVDAAVYRERIVTIGRREARARVAHLFCELHARLDVVGLVQDCGFDLPLVQSDVADATGLTPIHVNRMLKALRDDGLMTFRESRVTIHDLTGLRRVADFDPAYLFLDRQPR